MLAVCITHGERAYELSLLEDMVRRRTELVRSFAD